MIYTKRNFNNGIENCLEIYSDSFKIIDKTNNQKWNATSENPITITEKRSTDYVESEELLDATNLNVESA